jgi:hypothetical protein
VHALRDHLYCLRCGARPNRVHLRVTSDKPNAARGRLPSSEEGWKRLVRGLRGYPGRRLTKRTVGRRPSCRHVARLTRCADANPFH